MPPAFTLRARVNQICWVSFLVILFCRTGKGAGKEGKKNSKANSKWKREIGILFCYSCVSKGLPSPSKLDLKVTMHPHENRGIACNQKLIFEPVYDINSYYVVNTKPLQARNLDICVSQVIVHLRPMPGPDDTSPQEIPTCIPQLKRSFTCKSMNKMSSKQLKIDKHIRK